MFEQEPSRTVLQNIAPSDPRHAQFACFLGLRTEQIELSVAAFSFAGFPGAAAHWSQRRVQPAKDGVEFGLRPHRGVLLALECNHAHLLLLSAPNSSRCSSGS